MQTFVLTQIPHPTWPGGFEQLAELQLRSGQSSAVEPGGQHGTSAG